MKSKVGSFNTGTGSVSSTVSVSGLGFQPKAIFFWWSGRSESTPTVSRADHKRGVGFCGGLTDRAFIAHQAEDSVGTTNTDRGSRDDGCIGIISTAGAWDGRLDLQSFDSDGFTLVVDQVMGQDLRVHFLALGGTSLTNTKVGNFIGNNSLGNQAITGVGFQPDIVFFFSYGKNSAPPSLLSPERGCTLGGMVAATEQGYLSNSSDDGAGTSATWAACHQGLEAHMRSNVSGSEKARFKFSSFDADGFTVNWTEADTDAVVYFALKGGNFAVRELDSRTDTADIIVTGLGFQPSAALHLAAHAAEDGTNSSHNPDSSSIGAWSATDERAVHVVYDLDNQSTSAVATGTREDAIYARFNGTPAFSALMDLKSVDADGFTCVMDTAEPSSAAHHTVFIFGPRDVAVPVSQTEVSPYESLQTIDGTEVPPWESSQGIDQQNTPATESQQGIAEGEGVSYENLLTVTASLGISWESSQSILQTSNPATESLLGIRQSNLPAWETGSGINQTLGVPWTSEGTIASSSETLWDSAGSVSSSDETPWESLLGVSQSNVPLAEFLQGLHPDIGIFWEARGGVLSGDAIFWEAVRTPVAANVPPISMEVLRGLHPAPDIFWESQGPITSSSGHAYEWLHFIQQTQSDSVENLKGATGTLAPFWESRGFVFSAVASGTVFWESLSKPVTQTVIVEWESVQGLQPGASPPWESVQGLRIPGSVFWDSRGLLTVDVGTIIEWLLTVKSGAAGPSGLTMLDDGLVESEDFDVPDSNNVGTGWTESGEAAPSDLQNLGNVAVHGNFNQVVSFYRSLPVHPLGSVMLQANIRPDGASASIGLRLRQDPTPAGPNEIDSGYDGGAAPIGGGFTVNKFVGGVPVQSATGGFAFTLGSWYTVRIVIRDLGATLVLSNYSTGILAGPEDLTVKPSLRATITDLSPISAASPNDTYGGAAYRNGAWNRLLLMKGADIIVSGLPTGYKAKVDSETAVVESGGVATIPAETFALPATTITILDPLDTPVDSLSPPGGFYGGALFSFAPVGSPVGEVNWESLAGLEPDFTVPIEILAGPTQGETIPWTSEGHLGVPVSPFWESRGSVTPATAEISWESLLGISQERETRWASIGPVRNDETVFWEARGKIQSPRSTAWESGQLLHPTTLTPWESLLSVPSVLNCPWESSQVVRKPSSPLYERLRGSSGSQMAPWASGGAVSASEAIFVEMLLGLHPEISPPWESGGGVAKLVIPFWESRGPVFESVETLYEILQGGSQTISVEVLHEILLGVRGTVEIPYEALPGLGTIIGPTVTIQRKQVLRPTRAGLPFPEPSLYDPITGELHDPELAIIGPPQPVSAAVEVPWESTEELIDTSIEYIATLLSVFGGTILFGDVPGKKIRVVSYAATRAAGTPNVRIRFRESSTGPIIYEIGPLGNGIVFTGASDLPAFETAAGAELHADLAGGIPFQNVFIHMAIVRV